MDASTLLQRQAEMEGSLREPPKSVRDLVQVREVLHLLSAFFTDIGKVAKRTRNTPEAVFQCLMHISSEWNDSGFDQQHQRGNVPMHQAKVLNRLEAAHLEPELRSHIGDEGVARMATQCKVLRRLLRMKVEDSNDLRMAKEMVLLAEDYLDHVFHRAQGSAERSFDIYSATTVEELKAALRGTPGGGKGEAMGTADSVALAPDEEGRVPEVGGDLDRYLVPLPNGLGIVEAIRRLACQHLTDPASSAPARQRALHQIHVWLRSMSQRTAANCLSETVVVLADAIQRQVSEKRSAIFRSACDVVSVLCLRSSPALFSEPRVLDVFGRWTATLLKSVFVTVAAIASAAVQVLVDIVVSSNGAPKIQLELIDALRCGSQSELRRQCISLLSLGLVASQALPGGTSPSATAAFASIAQVAATYTGMGDAHCRRAARVLCVVLHEVTGTRAAVGDQKVERMIEQGREEICRACETVETFERVILGHKVPSEAAHQWETKATGWNSTSTPPQWVQRRPISNVARRSTDRAIPAATAASLESSLHRHSPGRPSAASNEVAMPRGGPSATFSPLTASRPVIFSESLKRSLQLGSTGRGQL